MANGPALSTARGGEIYLGNEIRDSFSLLDVLYANQFEGETFDANLCEQTEEHFYRGAPPTWLNFHISEQPKSNNEGTPFIKREGYNLLVEKIRERKKRSGISTVNLFHQPGCGGTTLAMQVLWEFKKTLRCAVLTGSTSDITNVAEEVVHLFTAGSRGHQNTVLLLVNNEQILKNLKESIMITIAEQKIVTHMPVVILLSCVRKDAVLQGDHVILKRVLSDTEKQKFNEKKEELSRRHSDKYKQFYGFHIMQTNFSPAYIKTTCAVFKNIVKANRPLKTQLAAFLSLLNAYVPGSYLLESQCLDFLKREDSNHEDLSLEDRMMPFSDLIITFQQDMRSERKVCMAHPMIAQCCTEMMAEAGVTRSDTARNFLTCLCRDDVPPCLHGFIKDMLTKRETIIVENPIDGTEKEEKEKFSRLIQDITKEGNRQSTLVLKSASNTFVKNPFFPQALARFHYIVLKNYNLAEMWANRAKARDPQNSFIADTLGQVHKNHLKSKEFPHKVGDLKPREILQLARKAIEAFKEEEQLAENELDTDMKEDGETKVSHIFNTRGQFGYLQVCNLVYDLLVSQKETWRRVLTKNVSMGSVLELLGDNKLFRFNDLINSLRDEAEKKCAFLYQYLTYSKPEMIKDDPPYIDRDVSDCYRKYVRDSSPINFEQKGTDFIQKLKQKLADTSAGVLTCLDRGCTKSDLKEIRQWWEEICQRENSVTALANHIFAHIMLINTGEMSDCKSLTAFRQKMPLSYKDPPELHMLVLLLYWPTDSEDKCVSDLSQLIQCMRSSYENAYKTYFRSRYLQPLFFIGKGQDLKRIVHRKVLENFFPQENEEIKENWSNEKMFQRSEVQGRLLKVEGVVRLYKVYATIGVKDIEVDANLPNCLWKDCNVSFYLGFTIRGPVAFDIQTKKVEVSNTPTSKPGQTKPERSASRDTTSEVSNTLTSKPWQTKPEGSASRDTTSASGKHFVDRHQTALISRVRDTEYILGKLKKRGFISKEKNDAVAALKSPQDQMEGILQCLTSASPRGKDALYEILKGMRSMRPLICELEELE